MQEKQLHDTFLLKDRWPRKSRELEPPTSHYARLWAQNARNTIARHIPEVSWTGFMQNRLFAREAFKQCYSKAMCTLGVCSDFCDFCSIFSGAALCLHLATHPRSVATFEGWFDRQSKKSSKSVRTFFVQQKLGRHSVGVWIGGVWNGHFPESKKLFIRGWNFQENSWNSPEGAIFAKFQAMKFKIQSPKKCKSIAQPFHAPTRFPPKNSERATGAEKASCSCPKRCCCRVQARCFSW